MRKILILFIAALTFSVDGLAQCAAGEVEVMVIVNTDDYGYEGYWQLRPAGTACDVGVIAEGGNLAVGCNGAGAQTQSNGGYANNTEIQEGPYCLDDGVEYNLFYSDDYGDGGFSFRIRVNGYQINSFDGVGLGATYSFIAEEPEQFDLAVMGSNIYAYVETGSYDLEAHIFNNGTENITSYDLNYTVNGGAVSTHSVSGTSLANYESEEIIHSTPISISSNGVYTIKIWTDNVNGNTDQYNFNDTISVQTEAGPGIPNYLDQYLGGGITIETIASTSEQVSDPTDLDFHPVLSNNELWVVNRGTENSGSSTVTISNAGEASQSEIRKTDGNAWHFMSLTTAMAFSNNGNWGSAPGVYDANHDGGAPFTGPALWSSDMSIYAEPSGGNGSHLDMLHASPYCQGIAAENDNVFWIFDGNSSDIVRYDFAEDHGPGNSYHGDAIIRRYSDNTVAKDPSNVIVSHMVLDQEKQWLYSVDHGNQRVIRLDITTGTNLGNNAQFSANEPVVEYSRIEGYTQEDVVTGLSKPAGIDVIEDRMIVSEYVTGEIIIYDISVMPAVELGRLSTGLSSVQGIKIGPKGRIWFVDGNSNGVYRINKDGLSIEENSIDFAVYPNPNNGTFTITYDKSINGDVVISNMMGQTVYSENFSGGSMLINQDLTPGIYMVKVLDQQAELVTKKIIIR